MPANFARIRIAGFKSFADPTSIEILPGLTGIVGPNGCGKSNVVDALRWAMGEASVKAMRGGEMDDVIFAGTVTRPARNVAEVVISLTETAGQGTSPFQAEAELQICRKLQRGAGSSYRVNGRDARARDVATLFADFSSGSRNSAMISQGRVSALVMAPPHERRTILEEAAGITGLHSRRYEAELKLRAAEQNLGRAEDLRSQQEDRLTSLRKQARQASRYRNLSAAIHEAEAESLAVERHIAETRRQAAQAELAAARESVRAAQTERDKSAGLELRAVNSLPAQRNHDSETRTILERARIELEQIDAEIGRIQGLRAEAGSRLATLICDHQHAERIAADADAAKSRLVEERNRLEADRLANPSVVAAVAEFARCAEAALDRAEAAAQAATEAFAHDAANRQSSTSLLNLARERAKQASERALDSITAHERVIAELIAPDSINAIGAQRAQAEEAHRLAEIAQTESQIAVRDAEAAHEQFKARAVVTRAAAQTAEAAAAKFRIEADALTSLLAQKFGREPDPVVDQLKVPAGIENALGAVLRDELAASTRPEAARHWRSLAAVPGNSGLVPLSAHVEAPAALQRALGMILLLPNDADGDDLQCSLNPGQILVSTDGGVWRWDGFVARAGAPSEASIRLAQRNRLDELQQALDVAQAIVVQSGKDLEQAESAQLAARNREDSTRAVRKVADARVDRARIAAATAIQSANRLNADAERLVAKEIAAAEVRARLATEAMEAADVLARAQAEFDALGDPQRVRTALVQARSAVTHARQTDAAAREAVQRETTETEQRDRRLILISRELADWTERAQDASSRTIDLAARLREARIVLAAVPTNTHADNLREAAKHSLDQAKIDQQNAARSLAEAELKGEAIAATVRRAEQQLGAMREVLVGAEASLREADFIWRSVTERVLERFGASAVLPMPAENSTDLAERARKRFERLTRERDEMGPVNLRAEIEVAEIEERLTTIERERNDIAAAIAKLRGSISHLNREGRGRLSTIFTEIDRHFQSLFTRMFGGGRAHLALTGSDDPLEAGLEIFAEPPGKKLATLSLLSGGEQALTALSLIFAVFRCNPAPISVLDEVDAPLDDANVDRFCTLLEDMAKETGTRFLVVTHHHLTMARMNWLYGVTMQERGISRILSVDLGAATALVAQQEVIAAE